MFFASALEPERGLVQDDDDSILAILDEGGWVRHVDLELLLGGVEGKLESKVDALGGEEEPGPVLFRVLLGLALALSSHGADYREGDFLLPLDLRFASAVELVVC